MKLDKEKKKIFAVLLFLLITLIGISAYITDVDVIGDNYTIGEISIAVSGEDDDNAAEFLLPNEEWEFIRYVKNTGLNSAYVYMTVTIPYDVTYTQDLNGNQIEKNEKELGNVQLFTYGYNGIAGADYSNWTLVTSGMYKDMTIREVKNLMKCTSDTHAAIDEESKTITYVYAYTGEDPTTLEILLEDGVTPVVFDTMKFSNVADKKVAKYNLENAQGKIITNIYAIQGENILEDAMMNGDNSDGSDEIIAVWNVLNNAFNSEETKTKQ